MQGKDCGEMVLAWSALNRLKMHKDLAGCFPASDLSAVKKHWLQPTEPLVRIGDMGSTWLLHLNDMKALHKQLAVLQKPCMTQYLTKCAHKSLLYPRSLGAADHLHALPKVLSDLFITGGVTGMLEVDSTTQEAVRDAAIPLCHFLPPSEGHSAFAVFSSAVSNDDITKAMRRALVMVAHQASISIALAEVFIAAVAGTDGLLAYIKCTNVVRPVVIDAMQELHNKLRKASEEIFDKNADQVMDTIVNASSNEGGKHEMALLVMPYLNWRPTVELGTQVLDGLTAELATRATAWANDSKSILTALLPGDFERGLATGSTEERLGWLETNVLSEGKRHSSAQKALDVVGKVREYIQKCVEKDIQNAQLKSTLEAIDIAYKQADLYFCLGSAVNNALRKPTLTDFNREVGKQESLTCIAKMKRHDMWGPDAPDRICLARTVRIELALAAGFDAEAAEIEVDTPAPASDASKKRKFASI